MCARVRSACVLWPVHVPCCSASALWWWVRCCARGLTAARWTRDSSAYALRATWSTALKRFAYRTAYTVLCGRRGAALLARTTLSEVRSTMHKDHSVQSTERNRVNAGASPPVALMSEIALNVLKVKPTHVGAAPAAGAPPRAHDAPVRVTATDSTLR